jgi:hypothetical protein
MKKLSLSLVILFALFSLSGTTHSEKTRKQAVLSNQGIQCGPWISVDNLTSYGVSKVVIAGNGWSYTYNSPTFPIVLPGPQNGGWVSVTVNFSSSGLTGSVYVYDNFLDQVVACEEFDNHFVTFDFFGDCNDYDIFISEDPC